MINTALKPMSQRLYSTSSLLRSPITLNTASVARRSMSAFSQMSDNDPEVLEKEKHRQMNKKDKDWYEKLATHSEAAVKADKEHDKSPEELQKESLQGFKDDENK